MSADSADRKALLLRCGEILMRKAREEATPDELEELEANRLKLGLTPEELVTEVHKVVDKP
jgi:hypothetical protein